jgi:type II secretory pathway component PulJ
MTTPRHTMNSGYTLMELVVYLAIFIAISVVLVTSLTTVMRTYARAATYRTLQGNGELVMERIVREVRGATSITTGASTFGSHPGTLTLEGTDAGGTDHTITFDVSSSVARITDNAVTNNLSTTEVTVSNLVFRRIATAVGEAVKVELTLASVKGTPVSATFYSTVVLRGR